jgi:putative peptidoglycan lipid II flippase
MIKSDLQCCAILEPPNPMKHILRSTLTISFFFGLAKALSFLRQIVIARQFGLSAEIDSFNAANNFPDLLAALIAGGALAIALIPVLSEYLTEGGRTTMWELFSRVGNLAFVFALLASLVLILIADPLVRWEFGIAPGFPAEQQDLVVQLMRLDLIATLIFSISGLVVAGLQANQHFLLPALAPTMYSLGQIFGAIVLAPATGYQIGPITLPAYGMGIFGLVYGVILGAVLHLAVQIPGLIYFHFQWKPKFGLRDPGVRKVLKLLGPSLLAMFLFQLNFIARDNLASRLGEGAVTALTYGWTIMQFPETLIGTALATALLPTLSEQIARHEREIYHQTLEKVLRVLLALTLPVTVLLFVAMPILIEAIFAFRATDTALLTSITRAFLGGIIGYSLIETGVRAFYAQQRAYVPLTTGALRTLAYVLLSIFLFTRLGSTGIALADSVVAIAEGVLLFFLLHRGATAPMNLKGTLLRVGAASILSGIGVFAVYQWAGAPSFLLALGALLAGGLVVLPFIWPEMGLLIKL